MSKINWPAWPTAADVRSGELAIKIRSLQRNINEWKISYENKHKELVTTEMQRMQKNIDEWKLDYENKHQDLLTKHTHLKSDHEILKADLSWTLEFIFKLISK
jgi:hypothetical protein